MVTAAYMLTQLQTVISRFNSALQPAVLTFGSIHGSSAPNIIFDESALFNGTAVLARYLMDKLAD